MKGLFIAVGPLLVTLSSPAFLAAQPVPPDSASQRRLRAVLIEPTDVFPPAEAKGLIARVANGLNITTRPGIIRLELLLRPGDPFDSAKAAETERNLRALRVFRRARVDSIGTDSGLVLRVATQDAFTTRIEGSIEG